MIARQQHDRRGAVGQGVHKVESIESRGRNAAFDDVDAVQGCVQVQEVVPLVVVAHAVRELDLQRVLACAERYRGVVPRALDVPPVGAHEPHVIEVEIESEIDVLRTEVQHQRRVHGHAQVHVLEQGIWVIAAPKAIQVNDGLAVDKVGELVCALLVPGRDQPRVSLFIEQHHTVWVCEDVRAKLALEVGAPAPHVATLVVNAGMVGPGRDAKGAHAIGQVHQAGEGAGVTGVTAELAVVVAAPAEHLTFGGDGARVALTGVEVHHDGTVRQIHAVCCIHVDGAGRGGRGVAHLLLVVGAPTDDRRLG